MRLGLAAVFLMSSVNWVMAQELVVQQTNPPFLKWYQINTTSFRILYPQGIDQQAQRVANTLERIHDPESVSMGVKPKKISIILQNQSSNSNGFVQLAPRHSEFYVMPSQDYNFTGTNDWLTMLSSHEYRHVVQFQRSLVGFNKLIYLISGEQGLAGLASAAAPQWFWEGDAVATETAFTHSGRGRIPNFNLLLRTNFLEGRTFNYHKAYLESYKNKIPDWYVLGYHMVSYLREKTGDKDIWEKIARRSWGLSFIPFTFSTAIHKETGLYVKDLYKEMAAHLTQQWKNELEGLPITPFEQVNLRSTKVYTDYLYPQVLDDGSVVVQKSGIGDIEQLVVLKDGHEEKEYVQGVMNLTGMMSAVKSKVVWNEFRYDPRWQVRTYSIVKGYDLANKRATIISRASRYASAALSPDGLRVVTVETATSYQTRLVILDYYTGRVLKEIPNPQNDFISMPRWDPNGNSLVAMKTNKAGRTISRYDIDSGISVDLIPSSEENLAYPVPAGKYILYNSPYSQIDNIYALNSETKERFQVTCSKYGAYNPALSPDGKTIYYNEQTRNGFDVVKIPFDPASWRPLSQVKVGEGFYKHLVKQEQRPGLLDSVPQKEYPTRRYHRASGMINVHSWGPYFTNNFAQPQFGIISQDILSTTSINGGYQYDVNEKTGFIQSGISYQGFYPVIDFNVSRGNRSVNLGDATYAVVNGKDTTSVTKNVNFKWQETKLQIGLSVPLITTSSKYYSGITIGDFFGLTKITGFHNNIDGGGRLFPVALPQFLARDYLDNGSLLYNQFNFSAYHELKTSLRDIYPKWGQYINVASYSTPYGGDFSGNLFSVYGAVFFPGLFNHHSLNGLWGYENTRYGTANLATGEGLNTYLFTNQIPLPRGQSISRFQNFYSMSANYAFPLVYPDIAIGPILNVQRVTVNLFADYGYGQSNLNNKVSSQTYTSLGGEMKFDVNLMRLLQQFNFAVRYSYLVERQAVVVQFVVGNIPF